ncbi:MAG: FAD:protein FMN transferase, partial [Solirubrobacteraceae bacterium]
MIRHAEEVMGTVVSFVLRLDGLTEAAGREALDRACTTLHRADALFSTYRPDSPMSRLRRGEITVQDAPADLQDVLELCRTARRASGGWFDPWALPGGVDPTGLVKGWAAARALEDLRAAGVPAAMVNAAGDAAVFGLPDSDRSWRVGITDPLRPGALAWTTDVGAAIATSGTGERGAHILDPYAGGPSRAVLSATVTGPERARADALATAVAAGGH